MYADGSVAQAPDADAVAQLVAELRDKGIEAIAVCFLHSYANPAHEQLVGDIIARDRARACACRCRRTWCPRSASTSAPSTTVANVYVQGLVETYLAELVQRLRAAGHRRRAVPDAVVGRHLDGRNGQPLPDAAARVRAGGRRAGQRLLRPAGRRRTT